MELQRTAFQRGLKGAEMGWRWWWWRRGGGRDPAFFLTATFPFARTRPSRSFQIRDVANDEEVETRWDSSITFLLRTKRQRGREREREPECSFRFLERGSCTLGETWNVYFLFAFHIKISIKGIKIFITDSVTS